MNKGVRSLLDIVWYVFVFVLIQTAIQAIAAGIYAYMNDIGFDVIAKRMQTGQYGELQAITAVVSSFVTLLLFTLLKWAPVSRNWLSSRPWSVIIWSSLLAVGVILPTEWIYEQLQITIPEQTTALFEGVMKEPWGYIAVGIFVPIAEEAVFRGAILRTLLNLFDRRWHWFPIVISALIFGIIHMNLAQGIHAFVIGLLLGWMYYRTHSIIPGIVLHWINNTVAYIMFNMMPQLADGKLIDLFHGDDRMMYMGLGFSLCILLPSLFQLAVRMKRE
ncbi:MAG: CPBP family intramembrane metalloprotease [Prevotella sp.]|nr:CPBP family intramembrane metalloprotease [Prevotella sp.]